MRVLSLRFRMGREAPGLIRSLSGRGLLWQWEASLGSRDSLGAARLPLLAPAAPRHAAREPVPSRWVPAPAADALRLRKNPR